MIVGFTCSAFDLLHPGHIVMLEECKNNCDYLIVGLQTDPTIDRPNDKQKPVQSIYERYVQLTGCKYVDKIIPYDTEKDLENIMATMPINIRFLGDEYKSVLFTGKSICEYRGIKVFFNSPRLYSYSSTDLRKRTK
jgi:glycerol-3-phosphate cytidylyltransferase